MGTLNALEPATQDSH